MRAEVVARRAARVADPRVEPVRAQRRALVHRADAPIDSVLFVLPHVGVFGGVNRFFELARRFVEMGVECVIATPPAPPAAPGRPELPATRPDYPTVATIGLDEALGRAWDVVVCGDCTAGVMLTLPLFETRLSAVYLLNGWMRREGNARQIAAVDPDIVIANSSYAARWYGDLAPVVVPGGVDLDVFRPAADAPAARLRRPEPDPFRVAAYGGRLKDWKGFGVVVKACASLHKRGVPVELNVFDARPVRLDVPFAFRYHGKLVRTEVSDLLHGMDAMLSGEKDAGWSNPTAEAMACGVPVACTEAGTTDFAIDGADRARRRGRRPHRARQRGRAALARSGARLASGRGGARPHRGPRVGRRRALAARRVPRRPPRRQPPGRARPPRTPPARRAGGPRAAAAARAGAGVAGRGVTAMLVPPAPAGWTGVAHRLADAPPAAVVVPIHDGAAALAPCLDALVEHTPDAELVLVDDRSTDPAVGRLCAEALERRPDATLVLQRQSAGFVGAVNSGLRAAEPGRDVVLLNSDTVVTDGWLRKLRTAAHASADTATACPLSNAAGIFTVPEAHGDAPLPATVSPEVANRMLEDVSDRLYEQTPATSGFCLYVRRDALDAAGLLDDRLILRGYGDDNDLCERIAAAGGRHVVDDATFVAHERAGSFGAAKPALKRRNGQILKALHPDHHARLRAWEERSRLNEVRGAYAQALGRVLDGDATARARRARTSPRC